MKNFKLNISLLMVLACSWTSAHAILISTLAGDTYDIKTVTGALIGELDDQPWWDDSFLASELMTTVGDQLGTSFQTIGPITVPNTGPFFAVLGGIGLVNLFACTSGNPCVNTLGVFGASNAQVESSNAIFAVGRLVTTVPEPTTTALMALGIAGLGYRQRKA